MAKIKLLEDVDVVWWVETIQGKAEVDGEVVEFRYSENSKGSTCYIYDEANQQWVEDYDEKFEGLFEACGQLELTKDSVAGDEFDSDDYQ